jgi:1,4-dihydroxy-2-naphthoate octaprenyltransferase
VHGVVAFIRLSRPHFLAGGALLFALGATSGAGHASPSVFGALAMVAAIQLTAHYANEYADVDADRLVANRTLFSGGSGVLTHGELHPRVALRAARWATAVALVLAGIVAIDEPMAGLVGGVALLISWAYSLPPTRLLATGWGELATSVVVTCLVPAVGALSALGAIPRDLWWAMVALLPIHVAMMLAFELPDLDADRLADKTVLAVRMGESTTRISIAGLFALAGAVLLAGTIGGRLPAWGLAAAIPAAMTVWAARRRAFSLVTSSAVLTLIGATVAMLMA